MNYAITWVTLERYTALTGDTIDAVMARRANGQWTLGKQCKVLESRLWVNLAAVDQWIDGGARARREVAPADDGDEVSGARDSRAPSVLREVLVPGLRKDEVLWDISTIAQYLKREPQVVRERMACLPSFPKSIRVPTKTGRAQPLFLAEEVIAWTKQFKDKN